MKKISKKTLNSSFWRWWYGNLTCFSQEHMQTFGIHVVNASYYQGIV